MPACVGETGEIYNIGTRSELSVLQVAKDICQHLQLAPDEYIHFVKVCMLRRVLCLLTGVLCLLTVLVPAQPYPLTLRPWSRTASFRTGATSLTTATWRSLAGCRS